MTPATRVWHAIATMSELEPPVSLADVAAKCQCYEHEARARIRAAIAAGFVLEVDGGYALTADGWDRVKEVDGSGEPPE